MDYEATCTIHHNTRANEKSRVVRKIFSPGDLVELDDAEMKRLLKLGAIKAKEEPAEVDEGLEAGDQTTDDDPVDVSTHGLTVPQAREMIAGVTDQELLKAMLRGEKHHPEYEGGRSGVVDALEERIGELEEGVVDEDDEE